MILSIIICLIIFSIKDYKSFKNFIKNLLALKKKTNRKIEIFDKIDIKKKEDNSKNILNNQINELPKKDITKLRNNKKEVSKNTTFDNIISKNLNKKKNFSSKRNKHKHKYKKNKNIPKKSIINDYEINIMKYNDAIIFDKRSYCDYYFSLLKRGQLVLFTFFYKNDYNIRSIKISIFIIFLSLSYTVNALFFTDDTMHNIVEVKGKFNILYQLPKIIYSSLISSIINNIIIYLALSESSLIKLKNQIKNESKINKNFEKILIIKFILFFIIGFIILIAFWYYVSCFCIIYKNTQLFLLKDTLINFALSNLTPFIICLFPGIFRIPSLKVKSLNNSRLYKFSQLLESILS